jgi:hypothetical protein
MKGVKGILMKKIFSILLTLILTFPLLTQNAYAQEFIDLKTHWAKKEIELLKEKNLINGYEDGTFRPESAISRAESVSVVMRMLNFKDEKKGPLPFTDVPLSYWAKDAILNAYQNQLLSGYEDGQFRPSSPITKAEVTVLLARAFQLKEDVSSKEFKDVNQAHWAFSYIKKLAVNGLIEGTSDGLFQPDKAITRAEFSAVLARAIEKKIPLVAENPTPPQAAPTGLTAIPSTIYQLVAADWNIYSDGTHPVETTKGFNEALKWANANGKTTFKVPAGLYLIKKGQPADEYTPDPTAVIDMVPNMTFELDPNAIIQKETNSFPGYNTLRVGPTAQNVTLKGGTYKGDKLTHDYYAGAAKWAANQTYVVGDKVIPTNTVADSSGYYYEATKAGLSGSVEPVWTMGATFTDNQVTWKAVSRNTHENGGGIVLEGASNVIVDGVKAVDFTGDGMDVGAYSVTVEGLYEGSFVQESIDDQGKFVSDTTRIRLKNPIDFSKPIFQTNNTFRFWAPQHLTSDIFDVYFYKSDSTLLSVRKDEHFSPNQIKIPQGAAYAYAVFYAPATKGVFMTYWTDQHTKNAVIRNSEFAFNRRQGISMSGLDGVLVENNIFHDIKGTAPGFGIDVESGSFVPSYNLNIKKNHFYNNRGGDIVFADGNTAVVDNNIFDSATGFFAWEQFTHVTLSNNIFNNSGYGIRGKATITNNVVTNGGVSLLGDDITMDNTIMKDSALNVTPNKAYGAKISNLTMDFTGVNQNGLYLGGEPASFTNVTISGPSQLRNIVANDDRKGGYIFDNLKVINYGSLGLILPPGTYKNCYFEQNGPGSMSAGTGQYVFDQCTWKTKGTAISSYDAEAELTITNSVFESSGDQEWFQAPVIIADGVKNLILKDNTLTRKTSIAAGMPIIRVGKTGAPTQPISVIIRGNTITSDVLAPGIDTTLTSGGAPYYVENNILNLATFNLKANDINTNNLIK